MFSCLLDTFVKNKIQLMNHKNRSTDISQVPRFLAKHLRVIKNYILLKSKELFQSYTLFVQTLWLSVIKEHGTLWQNKIHTIQCIADMYDEECMKNRFQFICHENDTIKTLINLIPKHKLRVINLE